MAIQQKTPPFLTGSLLMIWRLSPAAELKTYFPTGQGRQQKTPPFLTGSLFDDLAASACGGTKDLLSHRTGQSFVVVAGTTKNPAISDGVSV